ncbi:MAG: DUF6531 domain-containing protein [Bdellovibrionota bacterium]
MGNSRQLILKTSVAVIVPILILGTMISKAYAKIDLLTASFESTWIDFEAGGVKLSRYYSSRSLHDGLFGFGWCSSLESKLEFTVPPAEGNNLFIKECDQKKEFAYDAASGNWKATDAVISRETDHYTMTTTRQNLTTRKMYDAANGRLLSLGNAGGALTLEYDRRGLLQDAATGEGLRLRFKFDEISRKIVRIEISTEDESKLKPLKLKLEYGYDSLNLVRALNGWSNTYHYGYDPLHNLTSITFPDRTSEEILYDTDRDQVLLFKGRNGCRENYSYSGAPQRMIAEAAKNCDGTITDRIKLEVDLTRITFTRNGVKTSQEIAR